MSAPAPAVARPTVFFLSDYGLSDEFVGVVHAVLLQLAPDAAVVDLTHGITPFDVRAGAEALARSVPHLGPGVVLGVVDPGVGGARRGVAVQAADGRWFVAPDNGLAVPAAELLGGVASAIALAKPPGVPATFDGRDVFAPAAAALARGEDPASVGAMVDPGSLVRLAPLTSTHAEEGGRRLLRAPVTWVDRFGNVQLLATEADGPPPGAAAVTVRLLELGAGAGAGAGTGRITQPATTPATQPATTARRVRAFGDLGEGEVGVLADANGRLALVVREGSAAAVTGLRTGGVVELVW